MTPDISFAFLLSTLKDDLAQSIALTGVVFFGS